jgi:signal transduction histidine kinase
MASVSLAVHKERGIAPGVRKTLFEPFRHASGRDGGAGLGLGLYIVEQLANAHRGSVGVESSEARGTTFRVQLPRAVRGAGHAAA